MSLSTKKKHGEYPQLKFKYHYDVVKLYPSVPLDKAIDVIVEYLKNDFNNVKTRTKLILVNIHQPIELWVSECYFLYNNLIWKLYNSGPIGLSIMVVLSECYLQRLEEKSITLSFAPSISPKTFKRYVDDSHARFENKHKSLQFLEILIKKAHPSSIPLNLRIIRSSLTSSISLLLIMELIPMILKPSESQPSRTYQSNLNQTWHPMFPFQFLKGSYLELMKSAQREWL